MQQLSSNTFLSNIENNMLSIKNISKIPEYNITNVRNKTINTVKKNIINVQNNIFYPKQRDQLFWIFFVIVNGNDAYETVNNYFITEKETKYKWIEDFRKNKELFKPIKVSRNSIEDELANKPKISLHCIKALCHMNDINVFYIDNKKYYEMITNDSKPVYVIEKINNKYGLKKNVDTETLDYYRQHYWQLENLDKPLKAISSYKVSDLTAICKKININYENLTKQKIYQEIMRFL